MDEISIADLVPLTHDMPAHLAYWRGLLDGARMAREQIADEGDLYHRHAVRNALQLVEMVDRRRAFDGEAA